MKRIFDLKTFGVFLSRNKFYTLVNVLGFSVSMMFVILIMLYAQQENSVDKCIDKADRIYSVCVYGDDNDKDILEGTHWQTQKALMKSFPQLETTCGVATERLETTVEEKPIQMTTVFTDSTFFRIFSFPMVQGDRQHVLDDMQAAVVEENFARRMWGGENPIGKRITLNEMEGLTVHVTGVYRNPGRTSLGKSDLIIRFEHMDKVNDYITAPHMGNASGALVFLLAKPGNDLSQMGPAFDEAYKQMGFWVYKLPGRETHTKLLRFSDRYFSKAYPAQYGGACREHARGQEAGEHTVRGGAGHTALRGVQLCEPEHCPRSKAGQGDGYAPPDGCAERRCADATHHGEHVPVHVLLPAEHSHGLVGTRVCGKHSADGD